MYILYINIYTCKRTVIYTNNNKQQKNIPPELSEIPSGLNVGRNNPRRNKNQNVQNLRCNVSKYNDPNNYTQNKRKHVRNKITTQDRKIKNKIRIQNKKNKKIRRRVAPERSARKRGIPPHDSGDAPTIPVDARHVTHKRTKTKRRVIYR